LYRVALSGVQNENSKRFDCTKEVCKNHVKVAMVHLYDVAGCDLWSGDLFFDVTRKRSSTESLAVAPIIFLTILFAVSDYGFSISWNRQKKWQWRNANSL